MAYQVFTIKNLSPDTTATISRFQFADDGGIQHSVDFAGWNSPWNGGGYVNLDDTLRSENKTFVSETSPISQVFREYYNSSTWHFLVVDDTTGINAGYTVEDVTFPESFVSGQVVVAVTSATWIEIDQAPDAPLVVDTSVLRFKDPVLPTYALEVNDTTNLQAGWIASGNGYSGQTIVSIESGTLLSMSNSPGSTPTVGQPITFTSDSDVMAVLAPGETKDFLVDYSNITSTPGTYNSQITITADLDGTVTLLPKGVVNINYTPVYTGGGGSSGDGGYDSVGGGFDVGIGGIDGGFAGLQGSEGFGFDASDGSFGGDTAFG